MSIQDENYPIINAEEVRQYIYCKRIIYFRRIMNYKGRKTKLMKHGTNYHNRRSRTKYVRIGDLENLFDKYIFDKTLRIGVKMDLLRILDTEIIPVEFKRFNRTPGIKSESHVYQLLIGGILAERKFNKKFITAEIKYWKGVTEKIQITQNQKNNALIIVKEIKLMIIKQQIPEPTTHQSKCTYCEYWNFCFRI